MPSAVQAHSKAIWRDSALGADMHQPTPIYLKHDGADVVFSSDRPEELAFYQIDANGDYVLIDLLKPGYLVFSGSDYTIDAVGPAVAVLMADGADITISTDLTQIQVADLYYDVGGADVWIVRRDAARLDAVQVGDDVQLY
jgi:hypothetical protein